MTRRILVLLGALSVAIAAIAAVPAFAPDESVFVRNLKPGAHETLLYVWTRDADQKESDFLAVVDANPKSGSYGKVIATVPTNSPANEAHHFGYTSKADRIFGAGMFSNKLFIYDVKRAPRKPRLIRTVDLDPTGYSGPHTLYAVPGGVLIAMLGAVGGGGPGALVMVDDDGKFKQAWPVVRPYGQPGYMYDVGVKLEMNRMITSSWAHPGHIKAGDHPQHSGKDVVVWDWKQKKVLQVQELDLAPLEVRWMHGRDGLGGFTNAAFGSSVWYWEDANRDGQLEFHRVIRLPDNSIPADMRVSYDNRYLYVSLWGGGKVQQYDIADPKNPKLVSEVALPQPNMMKLTPDSRRLYVTNSLLSSLDGNVRFGAWLIHVGPQGMKIDESFKPDFMSFPTGPAGAHDMLLR
jgi:selenium-binding protein 1